MNRTHGRSLFVTRSTARCKRIDRCRGCLDIRHAYIRTQRCKELENQNSSKTAAAVSFPIIVLKEEDLFRAEA
jgi:hypothetical protein